MSDARAPLLDLAWKWLPAGVIAGMVAAPIELALSASSVALVASDALGVVHLLIVLLAHHCGFGVVVATVGFAGEHALGVRQLPPAWAMWTLAIMAPLCTVLVVGALDLLGSTTVTEYPERITLMRNIVVLAAITGCGAVGGLLAWFLKKRLAKAQLLSAQRPIATVLVGLAAFVVLFQIYGAMAPVHMDGPVRLSALTVLLLLGIAARFWTPELARSSRRVLAAAALVLIGGCMTISGHDNHARYALHAHCPTGRGLATIVRSAIDVDGDGTAPTWLGGTDCAEGDASIGGAALDVAGDGIDQDCRGGDAVAPAPAPPADPWPGCKIRERSVLLITVEALRDTVLTEATMPNAFTLASQAHIFTRAYSPATQTMFSMGALFGGKVPSDMSAHNRLMDRDLKVDNHLGSRFRKAGYRTFGSTLFYFWTQGIHSGFEEMNPGKELQDVPSAGGKFEFNSGSMTTSLLAHLNKVGKERFFGWIHYPDSHAPYGPVAGGPELAAWDLYLEDVKYVDAHLGRLLQYFVATGLFDRTIIALSADHGEDFAEHGTEGHGPHVYETSVHVPLLIWVPECPPQQLHEQPVSLTRLGSTLESLAGQQPHGLTLFPTHNELVPVVSEVVHVGEAFRRAVIGTRYKLIVDVRNGGRVLFDLQQDPNERANVYRSHPAEAQRAEERYQRWLDSSGQR